MGFKATSTRRTSAASAVSSQSVVVNTPAGFAAVGATIKSNTSINLGVTTTGQTSAATVTTVSAGPVISNVQYLDANNVPYSDDIAVSTTGGNILINGTGFVTGSNVFVNSTLVSNTFISSTQIRAVLPAASSGNVNLMIFTPTNVGVIGTNAIRYSGFPSWTTAATALQNGIVANVALVASGDSTLTYSLQAGSSLPTGISLDSAGYLTGTPTGYTTNTVISPVIVVTDAEGQAAQQTINITVAVGDDYFKNTTLLLNGETSLLPFTNDASSNNSAVTLAGAARADNFSPYKSGYYSTYLDSSSYFTYAQPALGTTFTIEFWLFQTASVSNSTFYVGSASAGPLIGYNGATFSVAHQGGWSIASSSNPALNQWVHIAVVREGTGASQFKMYINGALTGTGTDATSFVSGTAQLGGNSIGACYISNFRITNNQALYTTTFTPSSTPLTAISGTSILACQSNRFIDSSSNNLALTLAGTPKVLPASPFAPNSTYSSYGSSYLNALGDYLSIADSTNFRIMSGDTTNFSVEGWFYWNTVTAQQTLFDKSGVNSVSFQNWSVDLNASKQIQLIWGASGTPGTSAIGVLATSIIPVVGQWYHIAFVKTAANWALFVNGTRATNYTGLNTANDANPTALKIGQGIQGQANGVAFQGYVADVRVLKGALVPYDATASTLTVPTAPLTAVTNTQLLTLQTTGAVNNRTILDNSGFNYPIAITGTAALGSFSPYSHTGWSNYFNGSTDYLTAPATSTAFGTNPWTIECWVYFTSLAVATVLVDTRNSAAGNNGVQCSIGTDGSVTWFEGSGTIVGVTSAAAITTNTWYHIAMARSGTGSGQCIMYINGVSKMTGTSNLSHAGYTTYIGRNAAAAQNYTAGYISNFRVVNGTAVYTTAFTPSTAPLTAVSGTSLLTCQSNRFVDNSTNNFALTTAGTPSTQAFSPFPPSASYDASVHGGSMYVSSATANYLTITDPNLWNTGATTPAFTVEAWVYPIGMTGGVIMSGMYANSKVPFVLGLGNGVGSPTTNTRVWFGYYSSTWTGELTTDSIPQNAWTHIAGVYNGTVRSLYINGVRTNSTTATWPAFSAITTAGYIGKRWDGTGGGDNGFNGYISDARITKGSAVYSGATLTVPTAPLTTASNPSLLLNMTNAGIVDAHGTANAGTLADAKLNTVIKKYGSASMYFDGTGDYLRIKYNPIYEMVAEDFTIECWVYRAVTGAEHNIAITRPSASSTGWNLRINSANTVSFYFTGGTTLSSTGTIPATTWTHIAFTKSGNTGRLFINGVLDGTTASMGTGNTSATDLRIGVDNTDAAGFMNGYIDDLRITRGFARYTANFTAPTSALLTK